MPAVKIELATGRRKQDLLMIRNVVMDSIIDVLQLPSDDRNIRLAEYHPDLFQMKPPYEVLIEITMFSGRTKDAKKKLYRTIADNLETNKLFEKQKVLIIVNEQPLENWGIRGGIPADEMDWEFNVKI